jgi:hypothetical protein
MVTQTEKHLAQTIVGLYKFVRLQQEALSRLIVQSEAISEVLTSSPDLKEPFAAAVAKAAAGKTSQWLSASLPIIDATIQSLQNTYGPWTN